MVESMLEVRSLALTYATQGKVVHALQDASLVIGKSEAVGVAGESGSGKSTLARAVMGLLPAGIARIVSGCIMVAGQDVTHYDQKQWTGVRGNPIAMVFQDPLSFLNPVLRVGDQIAESVRRHDPSADPVGRSSELLELVKLRREVRRSYPHELSGGMRQRVMLAIALGCRPRLLVADEPTTALDVTTQSEILALLRELRTTLDMSLLLISHDLGVLRWSCDRVYIMYAGHTIETGPTEHVLTRPRHPYTQGLIEASRLERGANGHFSTIGGDVPRLTQRFDLCPFLPRCHVSVDACRQTMPAPLNPSSAEQDGRCWRVQCPQEQRAAVHAAS
jgi:oligopeptide/dipeptide ABC transporter ATP-binding protein